MGYAYVFRAIEVVDSALDVGLTNEFSVVDIHDACIAHGVAVDVYNLYFLCHCGDAAAYDEDGSNEESDIVFHCFKVFAVWSEFFSPLMNSSTKLREFSHMHTFSDDKRCVPVENAGE